MDGLSSPLLSGAAFAAPVLLAPARGRGAAAGQEWIDITVGVDPDRTPTYPGDPPLTFSWVSSMAKGAEYNLTDVHMGAHTATHIDAPLHFVADGGSIEQIPFAKLIGPARLIECSPDAAAVDAAELAKHNWRGVTRILFKTRSSYADFWADKDFHTDFTYVAPDAAEMLAGAGVELVGIDYLSVEKFDAAEPAAHRTLLGKNVVIVEGLDLRHVSGGDYDFICLPLKLVGREGAPARAVVRRIH